MTQVNVPDVLQIISSSSIIDGRGAKKYFEKYFSELERLHDKHEQNFVAADQESDSVLGICGFSPDKFGTIGILWLTWFYVETTSQGKGLGTALLRHCLKSAEELETRKICVETSSHPIYEQSISLYLKFGFRVEGHIADYFEPGQHMIIMGYHCGNNTAQS